jgi:Phasin protein
MAQKQHPSEQPELSSLFSRVPTEFGEMGKKQIEAFSNAQTELLNNLQEINKHWVGRIQSESNIASEFVSKLTAARSIPDAMTACQEWTSRRLELMAEDGQHVLADTQKLIETGTHFLGNGWLAKGST